jgi:N-ethylmaleimide reductase
MGISSSSFISGWLNTREDAYGGELIVNRVRFTLETVDAIAAAIGSAHVCIRLSPFDRYNAMRPFKDEAETYLALARELSGRDLAYVHISDQTTMGEDPIPPDFMPRFRRGYAGTLIVAGGYLRENGQVALDTGAADLIAIGKPFISNPDLVARMRNGWPLTEWDRSKFYEGATTAISTIKCLRLEHC